MKFSLLCLVIMLTVAAAHAQERTAGQAYDAQVNWSTLNSKIDLVSTQNKAMSALLDKMTACNKASKMYNPASAAADSGGCVSPVADMKACPVNWNDVCGSCGCNFSGAQTGKGSSYWTQFTPPNTLRHGQVVGWRWKCSTNNFSSIQCLDGKLMRWNTGT